VRELKDGLVRHGASFETAALRLPQSLPRRRPGMRRFLNAINNAEITKIGQDAGADPAPKFSRINKAGGGKVSEADIVISRLPEKVCHNMQFLDFAETPVTAASYKM
jgi:hypothetical protein